MNNIMMNKEMTKAILEGRKTQTRRVIKGVDGYKYSRFTIEENLAHFNKTFGNYKAVKPKYQKDEVIWVREPARIDNFAYINENTSKVDIQCSYLSDDSKIEVSLADRFYDEFRNIPEWVSNCQGIPNGCIKEMARIFLKVTDVRVELLQDITFGDIIKEGCDLKCINELDHDDMNTKAILAVKDFEKEILNWWIQLWDSTTKIEYRWVNNPYTFVNGLKRVTNES